jgi:hypothetical protein
MRSHGQKLIGLLAIGMATHLGATGIEAVRQQTIVIPTQTAAWKAGRMSLFGDIDHNGLEDLLVVGPNEHRLWIYQQRTSGFKADPDQVIELPPETAWVALYDVDEHPGVELLMSIPTGLVYLRQNHGVFEAQKRTLIAAPQIFNGSAPPIFAPLQDLASKTNKMIPVINKGRAALFQKNNGWVWSEAQTLLLSPERSHWQVNRGEWMLGSNPSHSLQLRQNYQPSSTGNETNTQRTANDAIRRILKSMEKELSQGMHGADRVDVNGDNRSDLVLWRLTGDLDPKTDIYVYLRGTDGFPERPSQVLHGRGFPIPVGPWQENSPVVDLNGDGRCELVLVTLKTSVASWSSLVDMVMTRGVDCVLTIRSFKNGVFSRNPDTSLEVSTMLPDERGIQGHFLIDGDFNGDGFQDILVRRSLTQWAVYLYLPGRDGRAPQPALTLETPFEGALIIRDLNNDGRSDIIVAAYEEARLAIFLSPPPAVKARSQ